MHICILPFPDITDVVNHFSTRFDTAHVHAPAYLRVSACNHLNFGFQDDRKNHILI